MQNLLRVVSLSLMAAGYATLATVLFQGRTGHRNSPLLQTGLLDVAARVAVPRCSLATRCAGSST